MKQDPPEVSRIPYIPMLKEDNVRSGFFEYQEFITIRVKLPDYLRPVVAITVTGHKTRSVLEIYNIVSQADLQEAAHKHSQYVKKMTGTIEGAEEFIKSLKA